ncbi:MAG TPA: adenylate/guanylate cyclase domain-containing protein [Gemmatimonadales bacterium]|nr:adenylate/guanylate cyclase domain-containing protein [Gemmatimonadales bacterium]
MPLYRLVSTSGSQTFDLPPGRPLILGRGVATDVAIYEPTISRRHAELTVAADGVHVKDLGSSNGTSINGRRITAGRMGPNDSVSFGKLTFQLQAVPAPGDAAPPPPPTGAPAGGTIVRQLKLQGAAVTSDAAARKLNLLLSVAQKLSGELDIDRLLDTVVSVTFEVMQVDRVSILLKNDGTGELVPRISRTRVGDAEFQHVPRSIVRKVVEERLAVLTQNAATDTRFKGKSILQQSVRSAMCSPLMAQGDEVIGVLYVDNLAMANSFDDDDLQFLVAFSGLAAVAIGNSRYADRLQRQEMVRANFERYFAPNVAAEIARHEQEVRLGGDRRPMTVLFADIRNFTAMAEKMEPDAIAAMLTDYFTEMVEVIFEHGGTLDKFIGDALMALWGAPVAQPDDSRRAYQAAVAMQQTVEGLNQRWRAAGRPTIAVGIGINYGEVFVGNIGSHRRLEYTVIGDAVNVAQRLSAEAGPGEILVSEDFRRAVAAPVDAEHMPGTGLKGRTQTVEVFRVRW